MRAASFYAVEGGGLVAGYKESDPFYHSPAWKRARHVALTRDHGMCCVCMERFEHGLCVKPRRATMVHHIKPVKERPDLALSLSNLRSLCTICHNQLHPERRGGGGNGKKSVLREIRVIKI